MPRTTARPAFWILASLALLSWGILAWEWAAMAGFPLVSLVNALMFTGMVAAWPFLWGWRVGAQGVRHAAVCPECHNLRWSGLDFGFCLRCGSKRTARPMGF